MIVDLSERPDLLERCFDGTVQVVTCPRGHPQQADAPLLLHDPDHQRVIFSPAPEKDDDEQARNDLWQRLYRSLPPDQHGGYLKRLEIVPREDLGSVLREPSVSKTGLLSYLVSQLVNPPVPVRDLAGQIALYEEILTLLEQAKAPPDLWATIQSWLGIALLQHPQGDRAQNLERAIDALNSALTVHSRDSAPKEWARTQGNLANVYRFRVQGDRAENLELAIASYQMALSEFTIEQHGYEWGLIHSNLSDAYRERILGNYAENQELAIEAARMALEVLTRQAFPKEWANAHHNLALAFRYRIRGDRADNLERAIACLEKTLEVRTREAFPEDWASTQHQLSEAYFRRLAGDRAENLERAIATAEAALAVRTNESFPEDWARTQVNLGNAYFARIHGDREENLERAIRAFEATLQVRTLQSFPIDWASTQYNLAQAYLRRTRGQEEDNAERALECCLSALSVFTRDLFPQQGAMCHQVLGDIYARFARMGQPEHWPRALESYTTAFAAFSPDVFPVDHRLAAVSLGFAHVELEDWKSAYTSFTAARAAADRLYGGALTEPGKLAAIKENALVFQGLVHTCLRLDPPREVEAFLYAEEGRSRLLRDQLGALSLSPPRRIPAKLVEEEQGVLRALRDHENSLRHAPDNDRRQQLVDETALLRERLQEVWKSLEQEYGALDYVALRRGERPRWEDVQGWLKAQPRRIAVLEFFLLDEKIVRFLILPGEMKPKVLFSSLSVRESGELVKCLIREVHDASLGRRGPETWNVRAGPLVSDLLPFLEGVELLYLVPHGPLHYLPFHAIEVGGEPLLARFPIVYAPSVAVAIRVASSKSAGEAEREDREGPNALVVGNPTRDLPFAEREAVEVARLLGAQPMLRGTATKAAICAAWSNKTYAHFAGHAYFHSREPFASGLLCANGEVLTAREVLAQSLSLRLLTLSACESGLQSVETGDELMGLARAFLYAGTRTLILSLWKVDDLVTRKLMVGFYKRLVSLEGRRGILVDAFREAILEVRQEHPETCFWAPFIQVGDWHGSAAR